MRWKKTENWLNSCMQTGRQWQRKKLYKVHPEYFSKKNVYNLEHGYSIVNDKTFRTYFPEYDVKGLRGNN